MFDRRSDGVGRPPTGLWTAWGVCALILFTPLALMAENPTEAGTAIVNTAHLRYQVGGSVEVVSSNAVTLIVGRVRSVSLAPPRHLEARGGSTIVVPHRLTNGGNGTDLFELAIDVPSGWTITPYRDVDGDGDLSEADTLVTSAIELVAGEEAALLFVVEVPSDVSPGQATQVRITATNQADPTVTASVTDTFTTPDPMASLALEKAVDRSRAAFGDTLTYTLHYRVVGQGSAAEVRISDPIPEGSTYVLGSLLSSTASLTDAADDDDGVFEAASGRVVFSPGEVAAGADGWFSFQVVVGALLTDGATLLNQARADYRSGGVADSVVSAMVATSVVVPDVAIAKSVEAGDSVARGDPVTYTLVLRNPSADAAARAIDVVDTLPEGLDLVETLPEADVGADGRTLTWTIRDIPPGDSAVLVVRTRVALAFNDREIAGNRARFVGVTGLTGADSTRALPLAYENAPAALLSLTLVSAALEASVGEQVPLTLHLSNPGEQPLRDVHLVVDVPAGTRWIGSRSADGSDAPPHRINGPQVDISLSRPLAPGDTLSVRALLALVAADAPVLEIRAQAFGVLAESSGTIGTVASPKTVTWIRTRRNRALETRTVLGKVWLDANADGRQSEDEPGAAGVDVWTEDGELVRTDDDGKFSFVNLRPGRHAVRLDPLTLPNGFGLSRGAGGGEMRVIEVTGWTSPRVSFGLVPAAVQPPEGLPTEATESTPQAADVAGGGYARVASLRTDEARDEDRGRAFVEGPGIEFFHPHDGAVFGRDRLFVGVKGEAGRPVELFIGDSVVATGETRPDGVHDFIAVALEPGPQILRVRQLNSWGNARWDSLRVHIPGPVARVEFGVEELAIEADGRGRHRARVRLLDAWDAPVPPGRLVTVRVDGASLSGPDADPFSVGHQVVVENDGWSEVELVAGRDVGPGRLVVEAGDATGVLALDLGPSLRPLTVTGLGSVSVGAGPDAFGAVTARGRVGDRTSVTLSYDSRLLDRGREEFGRATDPLGEGEYAILGDASERRSDNVSRYAFAARVERDHDVFALGDLQTTDFAEGLTLARYTRSLSGAAARLETGAITWRAFGALTTQGLRQSQLRGDGSSGPYRLDIELIAGTERITVEVRARDNATRLLSQEELLRFIDYQIDYAQGTVLLKQPIPAADAFGNPVFLVVTYEAETGGSRSAVWGLRASGDAAGTPGLGAVDAIPLGVTFVRDDLALGGFELRGGDLGLQFGDRATLRSEVVQAASSDSTDVAVQLDGSLRLFDGRLDLTGHWLRIGDEFRNPANVGLLGGTEEVRTGAAIQFQGTDLGLEHERQNFGARDVRRSQTLLTGSRNVRDDLRLRVQLSDQSVAAQGLVDEGSAGQVKLTWTPHPRLSLWSEARKQLRSEGDALISGDFVGVGSSVQVAPGIVVEGRHLRVSPSDDGDPYSLTNLGLRTEFASGARAWGTYQLAGGVSGPTNAAVLGLSHRLRLGSDWTVNALVERRQGVQQAPLGDAVLALPFSGTEEDYWSTVLGAELLPEHASYRFSVKGEVRDGDTRSNRVLTAAGDVVVARALALLGRQEFVWTQSRQGAIERDSRRIWSLLGLAFRPVDSDDLNALAKVEWREDRDPGGVGVLRAAGRNRRFIATGELIWSATARVELGARYSMRRAQTMHFTAGGAPEPSVETTTDYAGFRADLDVAPRVGLRADVRLLSERSSATTLWDVAPGLVIHPLPSLEVLTGYRFGELSDPDFAVRSGEGWFSSLAFKVTEGTLHGLAAFWRSRLDR